MTISEYLGHLVEVTEGAGEPAARTHCYYCRLLERGKSYTERDDEAAARLADDYEVEPRSCFYTAQRLALYEGYQYVEGFALSHGIPIHHAWAVDDQGRVIDPTWYVTGSLSDDYFGVEIPAEFIQCYWLEHETADDLMWRWLRKLEEEPDA